MSPTTTQRHESCRPQTLHEVTLHTAGQETVSCCISCFSFLTQGSYNSFMVEKLTMHFLPIWLKRHSFSCVVSSIEPTFTCRRCDGCEVMIGDQWIKYAPTLICYLRPKETSTVLRSSVAFLRAPLTGSVETRGPLR